jgi:hypothetical protein
LDLSAGAAAELVFGAAWTELAKEFGASRPTTAAAEAPCRSDRRVTDFEAAAEAKGKTFFTEASEKSSAQAGKRQQGYTRERLLKMISSGRQETVLGAD